MKILISIIALLIVNAALSSVVPNGDFEKGRIWKSRTIPAAWRAGLGNDPEGIIELDNKIFYSGEKSLKLQSEVSASCITAASPMLEVPEGKKSIYISIQARCELKGKGRVVIMGYDGNGKKKMSRTAFTVAGKSDWRKLSEKVPLLPGIKKITISLRLYGIGSVWYDDLSASFEAPQKEADKDIKYIELKKWTDYLPHGAENTFEVNKKDDGQVELVWKDGMANFGICSNLLPVKKFQTFSFSASVKSTKDGAGQLMVRAFGKNGDLLMEEKSQELASPGKWTDLAKKFRTTLRVVKLQLFCMNKGQGDVCFKDIKLEKISAAELKAQFPVSYGCEPAEGDIHWNNGKAVFNTFTDSPCSLVFDFWGDKSALKDPEFVIELPLEVNIEQCFNNMPSDEKPLVTPEVLDFSRDGKKWRRYIYRDINSFKIIKPHPDFCRSLTFLFRPRDNKTLLNKDYPACSYVLNAGVKSPPRKFYVNFLPPMKKTPNPKNYSVLLWANWDTAATGDKLFTDILRKYEEAGMDTRASNNWGREQVFEQSRICAERGWRLAIPMGSSLVFHARALKKAVRYDGKEAYHTCPSMTLSEQGKKIIKRQILNIGKKTNLKKGDWAIFDYEPWQSQDWCYCPECLKRFSDFAGVKASIPEIRKKYWRKWAAFRIADTNAILAYATETVKSSFPGVKVGDYDYVLDFREKDLTRRFWNIPKDTRLSDEYLDAHYLSFYRFYGRRAFEFLDINARALKKSFVMVSLLSRYSDPKQGRYTRSITESMPPGKFRQAMLNGASAGASGHTIFPGTKIDGKYFLAIDAAMAEIAALEDFYQKGERIDSSVKAAVEWEGKPQKSKVDNFFAYRVHKLDRKYALTLFNFSRTGKLKCNIQVGTPSGKWRVLDVSSGKIIKSPASKDYWMKSELEAGIPLVIAPHGVALLLVSSL